MQIFKLIFIFIKSTLETLIWQANSNQNLKTSEDAYVFHQRMQVLLIIRCISDSDKSSESRFVRRTFSASMIILWHSKNWRNQSYPQNSDVCTIVRTLYLIWIKRFPQDWLYTRLPDLVNNGTIYSWHNLTASNSNQTRSTFIYKLEQVWSFGIRHLNNLKRAVTLLKSS